jgi:ribose 5-phosphate isomerase B
VIDLGPFSKDRVDYPDYAIKVCESVLADSCFTRYFDLRFRDRNVALQPTDTTVSEQHCATMPIRQPSHADIMMRMFYASVSVSWVKGVAESILDAWIAGGTFEGGRHCGRVDKLEAIKG